MTTRPALMVLHRFIQHPSPQAASMLVDIPALYSVLQHEWSLFGSYLAETLLASQFILDRGREVLVKLIVHTSPPKDVMVLDDSISWRTVSLPWLYKLFHSDVSFIGYLHSRLDAIIANLKFGTVQSILV